MYDDGHKKTTLIVDLADILKHKRRKEDELKFYQQELKKLQFRMTMVQQEIGLTETIIQMIETEKVVDLVDLMKSKRTPLDD